MRAVLCSDAHGDVATGGVPRFDDVAAAFEETIQAVKDHDAQAWVFLGDLCDPDHLRTLRTVALAMDVDRRLRERGKSVFWMPGNHDVVEDGFNTSTLSPLAAAGAHVISKPKAVFIENIHPKINPAWFVFLPYTATAAAYDPSEAVEKMAASIKAMEGHADAPVLVFSHLCLEGIAPGSETTDMPRGREVFWPLEAIKKAWPRASLFGGHYHRRQKFAGVQIVGSMERLSFGEEKDEPGYLLVET